MTTERQKIHKKTSSRPKRRCRWSLLQKHADALLLRRCLGSRGGSTAASRGGVLLLGHLGRIDATDKLKEDLANVRIRLGRGWSRQVREADTADKHKGESWAGGTRMEASGQAGGETVGEAVRRPAAYPQ